MSSQIFGESCMGIKLSASPALLSLFPVSMLRTLIHLVTQVREPLTLPFSFIPSVSCTYFISLDQIHSYFLWCVGFVFESQSSLIQESSLPLVGLTSFILHKVSRTWSVPTLIMLLWFNFRHWLFVYCPFQDKFQTL